MGDWYLQPDPAHPGQKVWVYDRNAPSPSPAPTGMLPIVQPSEPEQDDLSADDLDLDIVNTEKIAPLDEVLVQPPQDPDWRPEATA